MMNKGWWSIEEVPYYFSRSSIKFRGYMDLNPISVRLLGRSLLSNPSDCSCFNGRREFKKNGSFSGISPRYFEKGQWFGYKLFQWAARFLGWWSNASLLQSGNTKYSGFPSLAFVRGINQWPKNSPSKGPVMPKRFPFDDVIMSCVSWPYSLLQGIHVWHWSRGIYSSRHGNSTCW